MLWCMKIRFGFSCKGDNHLCVLHRQVLPVVILFSGWRAGEEGAPPRAFAFLSQPHRGGEPNWSLQPLPAWRCHFTDTVAGYPLDVLLWPRKNELSPLCSLRLRLTELLLQTPGSTWACLGTCLAFVCSHSPCVSLPSAVISTSIQDWKEKLFHKDRQPITLWRINPWCLSLTVLADGAEWGKNASNKGARPNCEKRTFKINESKEGF